MAVRQSGIGTSRRQSGSECTILRIQQNFKMAKEENICRETRQRPRGVSFESDVPKRSPRVLKGRVDDCNGLKVRPKNPIHL